MNFTVACLAPTGNAASNLPNGLTIHHTFSFSTTMGTMSKFPADMTTEQINRLKNRMDTSTLVCIIIDEISYVSPQLLAQIDNRLRQLMACPETSFGGISIILLGDFFQLPPVNAKNLFSSTWTLFGLHKELQFRRRIKPNN